MAVDVTVANPRVVVSVGTQEVTVSSSVSRTVVSTPAAVAVSVLTDTTQTVVSTDGSDEITVQPPAGVIRVATSITGGEVNTIANAGVGSSLVATPDKIGSALQLKGLLDSPSVVWAVVTNDLRPDVIGFAETSGPTDLVYGAIAAGELLRRVGSTVVGIPLSSVGVTDHGLLDGPSLLDDDHPQYHDGSLAFTGDLDMGTNAIANVGLVDGVDISAHVADATIHFTESSISHLNIADIGTNSHASIDSHIASILNPHSISLEQARTENNTVSGPIDMGSNLINAVTNPAADQDAATRDYHDRGYLSRKRRFFIESDFTDFGNFAEGVVAIVAGAGSKNGTVVGFDKTNHPGIWCLETGTTSAGRGFIISGSGRTLHVGGAGITRCGSIVKTGPTLSNAVDEYVLRTAFFSMGLPNLINEGIGFEYQFDQNGGRWQGITDDGIGQTSVDLGITVAVNTWYDLEVVINAAGTSVEFFIDGVSGGTITTTIPSGTGFDLFYNFHIMKLAGILNRAFYLDYYYIHQRVTR